MEKSDISMQQPLPLRREAIYQLIKDNGLVRVTDLSESLGVTSMTIRRDLEYLEKEGLIERTHGGAVATNRGVMEPLFTQKSLLHRAQKDAIAQGAALLVEDYDTLFINSGTTTLRLFHKINARHVKIVTNNACFPLDNFPDSLEVISTGGLFRKESYTYIGETAASTISQVFASKAFIGVDGFSAQHGMTTPVQAEAQINRLMIEHTRGQVIVLADSSKLGKVSNFFVAPINTVNKLITDPGICEHDKAEFEKLGIEVLICK